MDEKSCQKFCNENDKCNFVFLNEYNTCLLYQSCYKFRETNQDIIGTTYEKTASKGILLSV